MTNRVDVHVLHMPYEKPSWREKCLNQLAAEPVNVHHLDGIAGDIRAARNAAFRVGTAEYVSFVDLDDEITPGIFQHCIDILDQNPDVCGVYTMSHIIDENDNVVGFTHAFRPFLQESRCDFLEIHQLVVMRREKVIQMLDSHYDEIPLCVGAEVHMYWLMARNDPWIATKRLGYKWRVHSGGAHLEKSPLVDADQRRTSSFIFATYSDLKVNSHRRWNSERQSS